MGLWQRIRGVFIRENEPSFAKDDEPVVSLSPYPKPDTLGEEAASREGSEPPPESR